MLRYRSPGLADNIPGDRVLNGSGGRCTRARKGLTIILGKKTTRRRWRRRCLIGLASGLVSATTAWLALQRKPGWYAPQVLAGDAAQQARAEAVGFVDSIGDRLVFGSPFNVIVREADVNRWLGVLREVWPEAADSLPPELTRPAVHFEDGHIRAGAHFRNPSGWQTIVNLRLTAVSSDDGNDVVLTLVSIHLGAVPVPRSLLTFLAERVSKSRADGSTASSADGAGDRHRTPASLIAECFDGIRVPNRFVWFNGRRPFRIGSIAPSEGELRLAIEPLPRSGR